MEVQHNSPLPLSKGDPLFAFEEEWFKIKRKFAIVLKDKGELTDDQWELLMSSTEEIAKKYTPYGKGVYEYAKKNMLAFLDWANTVEKISREKAS